jgi:hypothetical protein
MTLKCQQIYGNAGIIMWQWTSVVKVHMDIGNWDEMLETCEELL